MEDYIKTVQTAKKYYSNGKHHCCEAIVQAVSEEIGLDKDSLLKICTPFGGGMAGNGATCGSLIAAYICLGAARGRNSLEDDRLPAAEPAGRIYKKFRERFGTIICNEIVGYDKTDPIAVAKYGDEMKAKVCVPLAGVVTGWIMEEFHDDHE